MVRRLCIFALLLSYVAFPNAARAQRTFDQVTKVTGTTSSFGNFNEPALQGDTLAVAAQGDGTGAPNGGALFIFERDANELDGWGLVTLRLASDVSAGLRMGTAIAFDGDTIVVGANSDDHAGADAGSAYVFQRDAGGPDNWGQVKKLIASDPETFDLFGAAVAISGDYAVVVAPLEDEGGFNSGSIYVFERNAGGADNWGQTKKIVAPAGGFGAAITLEGDRALVSGGGIVRVLERNAGGSDNWGEVKQLMGSDAGPADVFGSAVDLEGDTAVVGAYRQDIPGEFDVGAAYVFERNSGGADNWGETKKLTRATRLDDDFFGSSVCIDGDQIVIGAPGTDLFESNTGSAYLFERDEGGSDNWGETRTFTAPDAEDNDVFSPCAFEGDTLVIAAGGDDDAAPQAGAAYVFSTPVVRTFVTDADYAADFGGLDGGDAICRSEASAASLQGTWKALVSVNGTDKFGRLPGDLRVANLDRDILASDAGSLNGAIANTLDTTASGGTAPLGTRVWTGDFDADDNCVDFTATAGDPGRYGVSSETTSSWHDDGTAACSESNRLYCFRSSCPAIPASCTGPWEKGSLVVSETKYGKEKLVLKLLRGPALTQQDLGAPLATGGTTWTACLYTSAGTLAAEVEIDRAGDNCAGKPCWKAVGGNPGGKGWVYKDKERSVESVSVLSAKGGAAGKSKIILKAGNNAKNGQVGQPRGISEALSGSTSVTMQVHTDAPSQCFSVTLDDVKKDLGFFFQAKK